MNRFLSIRAGHFVGLLALLALMISVSAMAETPKPEPAKTKTDKAEVDVEAEAKAPEATSEPQVEAPAQEEPSPVSTDVPTPAKEMFHLKDGSSIFGTILEEGLGHYRIETVLGEMIIPKSSIKETFIRLEITDGSQLIGILREENDTDYLLETTMGGLTVSKNKVIAFEKSFDVKALIEKSVATTAIPDVKKEPKIKEPYSHNIEPLIDIFFDPTGYAFQPGDIYLSGLSFGYGLTDRMLLAVNMVELTGLNAVQFPNLHGQFKWNFFKHHFARNEWLMATGVGGDVLARSGYRTTKTIIIQEGTVKNNGSTDPQERTQWDDVSKTEQAPTYNRYRGFFDPEPGQDNSYQDYASHDTLEGSCGVLSQADETNRTIECTTNEPVDGFRAHIFLAHTYSWLLDKGGRFGWHTGGRVELNALNQITGWDRMPAYRLYSAFDFDLNRRFKLLGEIFFDPSYINPITDIEMIGIDFGVMYALTETFRFTVHLGAPFIGFYWRF